MCSGNRTICRLDAYGPPDVAAWAERNQRRPSDRDARPRRERYHSDYGAPLGRLSRSRISLPVLKNGTDFLSTET